MRRSFIIPVFLCLFPGSCTEKSIPLSRVVQKIADYNMYEYRYVGLMADISSQWARYEALLARSTESELLELCDHKSPVVRSYAFQGLVEKKSVNVFNVLTKHIPDTGSFDRTMGCMVDPCYVSDFYLEQVGYFPDDASAHSITSQQRELLDSMMLYGRAITIRGEYYNQIKLRSRAYLLQHLKPKLIYYSRLREIVLAGVMEALPALAKYKNPNDIPIIRKAYDAEGSFWEKIVFEAIENFPHPDLYDLVEKEVSNDIEADNDFGASTYRYYKALVNFHTPEAKELLAQALSKSNGESQKRRASHIKYLIETHPGEHVTRIR